MTPTIIQSITLHFREDPSDKAYQASIEDHSPDGFLAAKQATPCQQDP